MKVKGQICSTQKHKKEMGQAQIICVFHNRLSICTPLLHLRMGTGRCSKAEYPELKLEQYESRLFWPSALLPGVTWH